MPAAGIFHFDITQMFGISLYIQSAAGDYPASVCFMQCHYDPGQGWYFGDVGAFQFWISHEDLAAGAFERASCTFEAH